MMKVSDVLTNTNNEARAANLLQGKLKAFMPRAQRAVLMSNLRGEERRYFADMLIELADRIDKMPVTYAQDGLGQNAIVHLHYFKGSGDWFITEKDMSWPEDDYDQSYGWASLYGSPKDGELGYISITELVENGVELDLHWTLKSIDVAIKG